MSTTLINVKPDILAGLLLAVTRRQSLTPLSRYTATMGRSAEPSPAW